MSDWKEKLNQLHKEFEGGYAEDKIVELEYALFEFEKVIYNKAIDDFISKCVSCGIVGLSTFHDMSLIAEQLKAGGENDCICI